MYPLQRRKLRSGIGRFQLRGLSDGAVRCHLRPNRVHRLFAVLLDPGKRPNEMRVVGRAEPPTHAVAYSVADPFVAPLA